MLFLICYHTFRKIIYFVHSDYHYHPETILKIIAAIKIVTISTRGISVFFCFDSMLIMLVGEFDLWRIVLQFGFQLVLCFVRDNDGMQGWATRKRTVANARHGVGDGDGLQGIATTVSIIGWLSILYALNGRNVTIWILFRYKM